MPERRELHRALLFPLVLDALHAPNLHAWSKGRAPESLDGSGPTKDVEIAALEDYLLEHGQLVDSILDDDVLAVFGEIIAMICTDEEQPLHVSYNRVLWLLDGWRWLVNARLDESDPAVVLLACVAVGVGNHAAAFLGIEEGMRILMHLAGHPLESVRRAVLLGMRPMLTIHWARTYHELRRYALIGDAWQHLAAAQVLAMPDLLTDRARILDALDLHHAILAGYRHFAPAERVSPAARALYTELVNTLYTLLLVERPAGFAAARQWLTWGDTDIDGLVRQVVARQPLASFEEAAYFRQYLV